MFALAFFSVCVHSGACGRACAVTQSKYQSGFRKVFEKEVFRQLYDYLTTNFLLSKHQSGFRPKHSTVTALIQM